MKTFAEAKQAIEASVVSLDRSSSYSLDRIEKFLKELGSPQDTFKTVHIAGTSGKTSTSYFIASMLRAAGYKTGLSISPYINEINDRVQIDLEPLPEPVFCREMEEFLKIVNSSSVKLTYFELFVSFAYWYFAKSSLDYVVMEVGLGGLLDGTNVISRPDKVCVITDIDLDHTGILGNTVSQIAAQKAGIIQKNNQVFMFKQNDDINREINKRVKHNQADVHYARPDYGNLPDDLPEFQKRNWTLAKSTCEYIFKSDGKELSGQTWLKTTETTIPARFEVVAHNGKTVILDGAHNLHKIRSLIKSFKLRFPGQSPAVLFAVGDNKDTQVGNISKEIDRLAKFTIVTRFKKGREASAESIEPASIAKNFDKHKVLIEADLEKSLKILLNRKEDLLLVTGSLYLVSSVKRYLKDLV